MTYLRGRYYSSELRRFITEDPAKDGMNWYAYCGNNPVMYADPSGNSAVDLTNPWSRQHAIWMNGVAALYLAGYSLSADMLYHSLRWFAASDVYVSDYWNGVNIEGSDRINGDNLIYSLRNSHVLNNEIDWNISCYEADGFSYFETDEMVLTLNDTTDLYLSFNNATVKLKGSRQPNGKWIVTVNVHDKYDFDIEKISDIDSVRTAIGGAAGTFATLEQTPIIGAIKTYDIYIEYYIER